MQASPVRNRGRSPATHRVRQFRRQYCPAPGGRMRCSAGSPVPVDRPSPPGRTARWRRQRPSATAGAEPDGKEPAGVPAMPPTPAPTAAPPRPAGLPAWPAAPHRRFAGPAPRQPHKAILTILRGRSANVAGGAHQLRGRLSAFSRTPVSAESTMLPRIARATGNCSTAAKPCIARTPAAVPLNAELSAAKKPARLG